MPEEDILEKGCNRMPGQILLVRFDQVLQVTAEPEVCRYLEEARRCFAAEAYSAAVVMAWCAIMLHLHLAITNIGLGFFDYHHRKLENREMPSELGQVNVGQVNDSILLRTCERMGLMPDIAAALQNFRECRNRCAHPTGQFVSEEEAIRLVETAVPFLQKTLQSIKLEDKVALREYAREANTIDNRLADWLDPQIRLEVAHGLLSMLLNDQEVGNSEGVRTLWRSVWNKLGPNQQDSLWNRLEWAVDEAYDNQSATPSPEEVFGYVVWPPADGNNPHRDRVGEAYLDGLECRLQENNFMAKDLQLAIDLRQHLPPSEQKNRLIGILSEMTRRLAE